MNAEDVLIYGHQTVLTVVEGLPDREWHTPGVCGVWSVQEIIAHLASFEQALVEILALLVKGGPTPLMERIGADPQKFNDDEVARRAGWSVEEVWKEYQEAQARTSDLLAQIPTSRRRQRGLVPGYGETYDLEDLLVYSYYGHKQEHCAQIGVFRDQLRNSAITADASGTAA